MRLESLEVDCFAVPPPYIGGMYWIFVTLRTRCGIEGVGEVYAATFHPKVMEAAIRDVFTRYLVDKDPHQIERCYREAYSSGFTQRPDLTMMGIVSGLEIACWDIIGKAADRPVSDLLGGRVHERLRTYSYLYPKNARGEYDYEDPDLAAQCAVEYVEKGYTAVKFDPAGPYSAYSGHQLSLEILDRCETFCRKLREAVGSRCDLLFGTHGQMTPAGALRLARRLEKYDPLWLEEPVPPGQASAMASVAAGTTIPIATGERLTTKYEFLEILQKGAASILQMNLGRVGGLLEAKKIAGMAEAHYAQIAPHLYNGPVGLAASLQLGAASPNFLIQECVLEATGHYARVLKKPLRWENGYLIPPTEPGLGIELDREYVRANPYRGDRLHLRMDPKPFDVKNPESEDWLQRWESEDER